MNRKIRIRMSVLICIVCLLFCGMRVDAAKVTISKKKTTLYVGQTVKIKVENSKKKVTWKSKNKKIAIVLKNGKITGKKAGKTTIIGQTGKKKIACVVNVKKLDKINVKIGNKNFEVKLAKTKAAQQLVKNLPMKISMKDLNGNEKYFYSNNTYTANEQSIGRIHTGDLMLFGNECIVLFYKDFNTSYHYTRLGNMIDTSKLEKTVGKGNVSVTLSFPGK